MATERGIGLTRDAYVMLAATFFYMGSTMLVNPLISGFTGSLGASAAFMGVVGGLMNLCALAIRPVAGNLSDRLHKKKLSTIGAIVLAVSTVAYAAATDPVQVAILRVVSGLGYAFCSVCMSTWFSSILPPAHLGSGMGVFGMMNALGQAIGPATGLALSSALGYRPALAFGGIMAAMTLVLVQFVRDPGAPAPRRADVPQPEASRRHLALWDRRVVPVALIVALFTIPYMATQSFLASFVEARGLDVSVGLFFPVYALVLLGLRFILKPQFDSVRFGPFLLASCVCAAASLALLGTMRTNVGMFAAAVFMAGGYGIMCSVCQSTAVRLVGPEHAGMANSTYYMGLDIGMTTGPMLGGLLYGSVDLNLFYPAFMVTVPLALMVYACSKGLRAR